MWVLINNTAAIIWVEGRPVKPGEKINLPYAPEGLRKLAQSNPNIILTTSDRIRVIRRPVTRYRIGRAQTEPERIEVVASPPPEDFSDIKELLADKSMAELRRILKNLGGSVKRTDKKVDLIDKIVDLLS